MARNVQLILIPFYRCLTVVGVAGAAVVAAVVGGGIDYLIFDAVLLVAYAAFVVANVAFAVVVVALFAAAVGVSNAVFVDVAAVVIITANRNCC